MHGRERRDEQQPIEQRTPRRAADRAEEKPGCERERAVRARVEEREARDARRLARHEAERQVRAVVVSGDARPRDADRIEEAADAPDLLVVTDGEAERAFRLAPAEPVRREHAVRARQGRELVPPRETALRIAVRQEQRLPGARVVVDDARAVDAYLAHTAAASAAKGRRQGATS